MREHHVITGEGRHRKVWGSPRLKIDMVNGVERQAELVFGNGIDPLSSARHFGGDCAGKREIGSGEELVDQFRSYLLFHPFWLTRVVSNEVNIEDRWIAKDQLMAADDEIKSALGRAP